MKYEDIASQVDYHAATTQYVVETYGEQVALQFPDVADTVWQCVMMRMSESQCQTTVWGDHRIPTPTIDK
jgi:hypothetical protein